MKEICILSVIIMKIARKDPFNKQKLLIKVTSSDGVKLYFYLFERDCANLQFSVSAFVIQA